MVIAGPLRNKLSPGTSLKGKPYKDGNDEVQMGTMGAQNTQELSATPVHFNWSVQCRFYSSMWHRSNMAGFSRQYWAIESASGVVLRTTPLADWGCIAWYKIDLLIHSTCTSTFCAPLPLYKSRQTEAEVCWNRLWVPRYWSQGTRLFKPMESRDLHSMTFITCCILYGVFTNPFSTLTTQNVG